LNEKYAGKITGKASKDIERVRAGEPVDYIIGYKNFLGCKINLQYKPLIPRDETEFWVKQAIENIKGKELISDFKILDMFAGSGCCGIAVLKHIEGSHCDFIDLDDNCIKQIKFNLRLNFLFNNGDRLESKFFNRPSTVSTHALLLLIISSVDINLLKHAQSRPCFSLR